MERYIIKYLMDSTHDEWRKRYYDYMRLALDHHLWSYGNNISSSLERWIDHKQNYVIPKHGIVRFILSKIKSKPQRVKPVESNIRVTSDKAYKYKLLAIYQKPYLPDDTIEALHQLGITVEYAYDEGKVWTDAMGRLNSWYSKMKFLPFNEIIMDNHIEELKEIYTSLLDAIKQSKIDALVVFTAEPFEAKILIDIFRELGRISMELIHGIPGSKPTEENRVDYVLTYGDGIKRIFLDAGFEEEKVLVSGNSKYVKYPDLIKDHLRCSTDDVLVLTSASSVEHQHQWEYDNFSTNDRSLLIAYLYSVEAVLKRVGVTHARLRPHPIVDKHWLSQFVDMDFYEMDYLSLSESYAKATCCIGQNSTAVLEAIQSGVSYIVYEPGDGKHSLTGDKLIPLYDGSNPYLKVAYKEEDLEQMINAHYCPDIRVLNGFMECFKPEVIKEVLDKHCNNK